MTPAEKEIQAVNDAYARAIAAYGAQVAAQMIQEWESINAANAAGRALLMARATALVLSARVVLAELVARRSQLIQALRTGTQMAGGPRRNTLKDLRDDYEASLTKVGVVRSLRAKALDPNTLIPVDSSLGSLGGIVEEVNDGIEDEIERAVILPGADRLSKIAKREGVITPEDIAKSRNMVASAVKRVALNGARHTDTKIAQNNKSIYGYLRVHNEHAGDEPCGFCAMLLSRGPVYLSKQSAGNYNDDTKEMDHYHFECHCTVETVYSYQDYMNNPKYELNRALQDEWKSVMKDQFSGVDEALPIWRKHMKKFLSERKTSAVQAAA